MEPDPIPERLPKKIIKSVITMTSLNPDLHIRNATAYDRALPTVSENFEEKQELAIARLLGPLVDSSQVGDNKEPGFISNFQV